MLEQWFHPLVVEWFRSAFGEPTDPQRNGWPEIVAGHDTLIAAPTGSGKTLSAFLSSIDRLVRDDVAGQLNNETRVVYVSPLKALSNDIHRNLDVPLEGIHETAAAHGVSLGGIRTAVRTGDTPSSQRQAMLRRVPHILVTTPESLYLMLTAEKSREILRSAETVIVDEIHALARDKRGSHLALTLERLDALAGRRLQRIGLSATQKPIDEIAGFHVGAGADGAARSCQIIDGGHARRLDLGIEVPPTPLEAVCSNEQWGEIYERLSELIRTHRSTLIFVNTRRLAERVTHHLSEQLGDDAVTSHHGSLSKERRLDAERRLKAGQLKAIVATASLELGIDIGYIDLVCQIGSPRSIATMLQRVGRSGHWLGATPCGRLFPLTRDDLVEAMALVRSVRAGRLDAIEIPDAPTDILAQQIVATVASEPCDEEPLFAMMRRAWPYRRLERKTFDEVIDMLGQGIDRTRRRGAHLHRDAVNRRLKARRGARIAAITSGGAIPDNADYSVLTEEGRVFVGTLNEDFAIESMAGDIFLLGNTSWQIRQVRSGEVIVRDADGAPATVPFWLGEAPGRTYELSEEVSQLRAELGERVGDPAEDRDGRPSATQAALDWLIAETNASKSAAQQIVDYVTMQKAALGLVPTHRQIVFERFFDESGGMQLVIHAPYGARINRAWGLALRKRFCRSFNFELQAAADDNGIVLSLGPQHSFAIDDLFRMLNTENAEYLLTQALLAAPMFQVRWRWNVTRALAVMRRQGGKKVPPPLQRFRADDLLSTVFPETTACLENHVGDLEVPDHPLVRQTVDDCLTEAMDVARWVDLLGKVERGEVELIPRDTREPSPFSYELLNANPYAFLDDAPLEERRARAVATRRSVALDEVRELAKLDEGAIAQVVGEAAPVVRDADELHDVLLLSVAIPADHEPQWRRGFEVLVADGRATQITVDDTRRFWVAAESCATAKVIWPGAVATPKLEFSDATAEAPETSAAVVSLVRGWLAIVGPTTVVQLAGMFALRESAVEAALEALEGEGYVLRGQFTPQAYEESRTAEREGRTDGKNLRTEWCERRLLARIHRLTLQGARRAIQPVDPAAYMRFLFVWQGLVGDVRRTGRRGLREIIGQLEGCDVAAGAWESAVLPARLDDYQSEWLDDLTLYGEAVWGRLQPPAFSANRRFRGTLNRAVPIHIVLREDLDWLIDHNGSDESMPRVSAAAQDVYAALDSRGAMFFQDLARATEMPPSQLERVLGELIAVGRITADGFSALRPLVRSKASTSSRTERRRRRRPAQGKSAWRGGRWSLLHRRHADADEDERIEHWAELLLRRWGIVFRDLMNYEPLAPPWFRIVRVLRRLEAQGKVRGGRFVTGVAGEQYGSTDAVDGLRAVRDATAAGGDAEYVVISGADPINLSGTITDSPRVPAKRTAQMVWRQGRLIAWRDRSGFHGMDPLDEATRQKVVELLGPQSTARTQPKEPRMGRRTYSNYPGQYMRSRSR